MANAPISADTLVEFAKQFLGTPYVYGGESPKGGFDCSGLVQYIFSAYGVNVPRTSEEQFGAGSAVAKADLLPGDAVFYRGGGKDPPPGHEALYIGNGQVIVAPHTGDHVRIVALDSIPGYMGARRLAKLTVGGATDVAPKVATTTGAAPSMPATPRFDLPPAPAAVSAPTAPVSGGGAALATTPTLPDVAAALPGQPPVDAGPPGIGLPGSVDLASPHRQVAESWQLVSQVFGDPEAQRWAQNSLLGAG